MTTGHLVRGIALACSLTLGLARTTRGQTAVIDPWNKVPPAPTSCYRDDAFDARLSAASQELLADNNRHVALNERLTARFNSMEPMERMRLGPVLAAGLCAITPANVSSQGASATVWENYDFVPGSKVLFYTDFSEDIVGNFARGLKYVSGPAEVVERDGVKMLRATGRAEFLIPVNRVLPSRFTIEIDVLPALEPPAGYDIVAFEGGPEMDRGDKSAEINWSPETTMIIGGGRDREQRFPDDVAQKAKGALTHLRILVDGPYLKMYANERRIHNVPELPFKRDAVIRVSFKGGDENNPTFLTGVRVAESETDILYDALTAKGRWATQGILFATGKADLQPESRPVLKEIASTLKQHADLKILIEGHTDNVGSAASNLALSEARAAAVKGALVAEFGVDGNRITTKGLGDTKPSVPNTTATGRAQNRRVEVVKQ